MGFRVLVVNARSHCDLRLGYIVVRKNFNEEEKVFLDEINTIIFTSPMISFSSALLVECAKRNIKVILSDEKHLPRAEVLSYQTNSDVVRRTREQFLWDRDVKGDVWAEIVKCKIQNQAFVMRKIENEDIANEIMSFSFNVQRDDVTNREGHAAKVYFNNFLPDGVQRHTDGLLNSCLDYGYIMLMSSFSQSIVSNGYLSEIGIHHRSENNAYNFSCDLMEPFRFIVDLVAFRFVHKKEDKDFKKAMRSMFEVKVMLLDNKTYELFTAINEYVRSVIRSLNTGDIDIIKFPIDIKEEEGE